jgi:hypothetical protein
MTFIAVKHGWELAFTMMVTVVPLSNFEQDMEGPRLSYSGKINKNT